MASGAGRVRVRLEGQVAIIPAARPARLGLRAALLEEGARVLIADIVDPAAAARNWNAPARSMRWHDVASALSVEAM